MAPWQDCGRIDFDRFAASPGKILIDAVVRTVIGNVEMVHKKGSRIVKDDRLHG